MRGAVILCGLLILGFVSCRRNELCYDHPHGELVVATDWSNLYDPTYEPEGVKVSFYDIVTNTENTSYRPAQGGAIAVNDGEYNLLVVNSDTEVIRFRTTERFETAEAYLPYLDAKSTIQYSDNPAINRAVRSEMVIPAPDLHLVNSVSRHTLTHRANRANDTLTITPITCLRGLSLEVNLLRSEKCRAARGAISGVAQAINLSTGKITGSSGTMQLTMTKDGDRYKALIQIMGFVSSGAEVPPEDRIKQILRLEFLLVDGSVHVVETDVSSQIDPDAPQLIFRIAVAEVEIPDVEPEGGFDADIGNWGDEVIIPL